LHQIVAKTTNKEEPMRRWIGRMAWILAIWLAGSCGASAQPVQGNQVLTDQQLTGMRLFNQSCRVCHTKPQLTSPLYGPQLSQSSAGGSAEVMREVIGNGTPRMPGFKYHFDPAQIEAIVAYLKTLPAPPPAASPAASR
jgi:mono/diheme cytochrome c family protein